MVSSLPSTTLPCYYWSTDPNMPTMANTSMPWHSMITSKFFGWRWLVVNGHTMELKSKSRLTGMLTWSCTDTRELMPHGLIKKNQEFYLRQRLIIIQMGLPRLKSTTRYKENTGRQEHSTSKKLLVLILMKMMLKHSTMVFKGVTCIL